MWIDREQHWSGKVYREIVPARSQPGHYVRRARGRAYLAGRLAEIRAKLDLVQVLANIRDTRAGRHFPLPSREPADGVCEQCRHPHPLLMWDGRRYLCPPCDAETWDGALFGSR